MKNYYTTGQAAKVLGVCIRTVQIWVEEGRIACWRTSGGHRRLDKASVDALAQTPGIQTAQHPQESGDAVRRILLVDDSKADSRLLRKMIRSIDPDVIIDDADDGFEALLKIGQQCPDILFVDMEMPYMNGFQMLDSLSQHHAAGQASVFVMTAYDAEELKSRGGVPALVKHVFHKPINMVEFVGILKGVL